MYFIKFFFTLCFGIRIGMVEDTVPIIKIAKYDLIVRNFNFD